MHTTAEKIAEALDGLLSQCADVDGAAVVSADGFPIASAFPDGASDDEVAALGAALLALSGRVAGALGRGNVRHIVCEGDAGSVFAATAGAAVLCASARPSAPAGLVLLELRRAASAVAAALPAERADVPSPTPQPSRPGLRLVPTDVVSAEVGESARIGTGIGGGAGETACAVPDGRPRGAPRGGPIELEITS